MSANSIGSSVLGTDLTSFLASRLNSEGIKVQSSAGEVTTTTTNGGSVTRIGTGSNARVVSETSSNGETVTEVGYESPVLVQNFLNSLEQVLQSDGLETTSGTSTGSGTTTANASAATASTSTDITSNSGNTTLASSIQSLLTQLDSGSGPASANGGLLTSFNSLLQGSGIETSDTSSGLSSSSTGSSASALQAFLSNALSGLPTSSSLGQSVNYSA